MSGRLRHPEFLASFRAGDREALSLVYATYVEDVARVIRLGASVSVAGRTVVVPGVRSPYEQQEALQEVFRKAFEPKARAAYTGKVAYKSYLRAIACNHLVNRATRQREHVGVEALEPGSPLVEAAAPVAGGRFVAQPETPAEQGMSAAQLSAVIRRFLAETEPRERQVTELRFLEGLSQRDAAEAMGMSRSVLRKLEDRIRPALTSWLRAHGYEHAEVFD